MSEQNGHIETPKTQVIIAFEVTEGVGGQVRINSSNEAFLALAVRRINQVVDLYLAEQEAKRIQEAKIVVAKTVAQAPQSVMDRLRA